MRSSKLVRIFLPVQNASRLLFAPLDPRLVLNMIPSLLSNKDAAFIARASSEKIANFEPAIGELAYNELKPAIEVCGRYLSEVSRQFCHFCSANVFFSAEQNCEK